LGETNQSKNGYETEVPRDRTVLAGVNLPDAWSGGLGGQTDLPELGRLADTAGADVVGQVEQNRHRPAPSTFLGKGKLEELQELIEETEANLVIFDNDLSPAQGRNLEKVLDVNVIDRTELILDIFARHASTRQAPPAGRAGPAAVHAAAPDPALVAPRAAGRRHRHPRSR
jgi:GTP-binding protein HflX